MEWSETHEYQLASCSQDGSVKLFDMTNPRRAETVIHTTGPVWRVRYLHLPTLCYTHTYTPTAHEKGEMTVNLHCDTTEFGFQTEICPQIPFCHFGHKIN